MSFRKEFVIASIIAAALMFIGLVLLGIPGAIFLEMPKWLGLVKGIEGDGAWPAAIFVSLMWPLFIPLGVIAKYRIVDSGFHDTGKGFFMGDHCWRDCARGDGGAFVQ